MAMGCPHQGRSGGLNATITSRPFDSPRPSPGGYVRADQRASYPTGSCVSAKDLAGKIATFVTAYNGKACLVDWTATSDGLSPRRESFSAPGHEKTRRGASSGP